jgi:hypothetical protein
LRRLLVRFVETLNQLPVMSTIGAADTISRLGKREQDAEFILGHDLNRERLP